MTRHSDWMSDIWAPGSSEIASIYESVSLSRETLDAISKYAARAVWPSGFTVYQRGAQADGVFIGVGGRVVLRSRVKSGRGYIPTIVGPGGTFGGEGLAPAAPLPPRYVTEARTDAESETLYLSCTQYRALVREQPSAAIGLSAQVMAEHATLLEKLRELATLSVEQRLVTSLVRMTRQRTFLDADGRLVLDSAHYRVLCELVGATRESVSLVLNRLIASGAAVRKEGRVLVDSGAIHASQESAWSDAALPERPDTAGVGD
jgi:CRP/FNR family transcriptional regulator, cyclic AMP receptor protein